MSQCTPTWCACRKGTWFLHVPDILVIVFDMLIMDFWHIFWHVDQYVRHMKESCPYSTSHGIPIIRMSHTWLSHVQHSYTSHQWMSHVQHSYVTPMNESCPTFICHTHEWVMSNIHMSHTWTNHVLQTTHATLVTYEKAMSHIHMSHVPLTWVMSQLNESCPAYERVTPH